MSSHRSSPNAISNTLASGIVEEVLINSGLFPSFNDGTSGPGPQSEGGFEDANGPALGGLGRAGCSGNHVEPIVMLVVG